MKLGSLPNSVQMLLEKVEAPPRLVAHLTLVHDVAVKLVDNINSAFPELSIDKKSILFGAATHDIGKSIHQNELIESGNNHELAGEKLLLKLDVTPNLARFARTHAEWQNEKDIKLEDLFVTLADKCWKGKRVDELEKIIAEHIALLVDKETWEIFIILDDILEGLTKDADVRLAWQAQFTL